MSSGFVSGGSLDTPTERDEEWLKAQRELEEKRAAKAKLEEQQAGKSLFEILQSNKELTWQTPPEAAKQEAFEESAKLKNQFRALDDDEVDFLDAVLESGRARETAVKQETTEHLAAFKKLQEEAERKALLAEPGQSTIGPTIAMAADTENWAAVGRKRKKGKEKEGLLGLKSRKTSSSAGNPAADPEGQESKSLHAGNDNTTLTSSIALEEETKAKPNPRKALIAGPAKPPASRVGLLAGYSSDDGDDDE